MRTTNPAGCHSEIARRCPRITVAKAFRPTHPVRRVVGARGNITAVSVSAQRAVAYLGATVTLGIAIPARGVLRQRTSGVLPGSPAVGAALDGCFGQLARLVVVAACSSAFLVLMPAQAAE